MSVHRILVPVDLHAASAAKLPVATAQAKAFGAELILLHVQPQQRDAGSAVTLSESQARSYLDALVARLRAEGVAASGVLRWGTPAQTILEEIEEQQVDLVVLGSSTRNVISWLRLGSVAEEVVAKATCPVLLVRPPAAKAAPPPAVRNFSEDAARAGAVAPVALGVRTVEVARIVGSVGRADQSGAPGKGRTRLQQHGQRFQRILALMEQGVGLPPVELYKLGYGYYILDGHHRVAAAKQLGQLELEAEVTEFLPLGDAQSQRVAAERRAFERTTGLRRIGATCPGSYQHLEEEVRAFAARHKVDDLQDAARRWESEVYRPLATELRRRRLISRFPGERTADVFVRLMAAREEALRDGAAEPALEEAFSLLA